MGKKMIFLVVDSFHPKALKRALERRMVPALEFIVNRGFCSDRCVSVFPTMTPTCASSIATGTLPFQHLIPGFVWYHRREKRIINYGMSPLAVIKLGVRRVVQDLLFNLNHNQLSNKVKTIYETLEQGGFTTGAVNPFIFRACREHNTKMPLSLKIASAFGLGGPVLGPGKLFLGRIVPPPGLKGILLTQQHFFHKYGVNDRYSGAVAEWIIRSGFQPDLLSLYLPDNDGYAHRRDPALTEDSLARVDRQLQKIMNCFRDWEDALEKNIFVIAGDHSQSLVETSGEHIINLPAILNRFSLLKLGKSPGGGEDMAVCVNERMCHIYFLNNNADLRGRVLETLGRESRIDQISWKENGWYRVARGGNGEEIFFRPGDVYRDEYGQGWEISGKPAVLDVELGEGRVVYGDYPDTFNRLMGLLECENAGDVVLTARPGYEFMDEYSTSHRGGGSHGALHREDSLVPLAISDRGYSLSNPRLQDIAALIRAYFGVASE
ncbi:alkaline phosphatase family protein [Desulfocucumis palustris]|uniref:alkaline phosphatase family protein n=1 Tax=Desulfocucumis palustris TaxID=1898651 RepID=UPI000FFF0CA1|nr:alkaline phosphatase family protein [Desulfocucumis palustris]